MKARTTERAIRPSLLALSVMLFMRSRWASCISVATISSRCSGAAVLLDRCTSAEEEDFAVLRDVFRFHPLALEDSEHFGQRAKLEDYDDFVFLVVYGAVPDEDRLVEVHCFYSERFLITLHRDEAPAFTEVRHRYEKRRLPIDDPALLLYRIIDALVDSFFPILADFDDRIDELENQTFLHASDEQLREIFAMKRLLVGMRKAVTPSGTCLPVCWAASPSCPG